MDFAKFEINYSIKINTIYSMSERCHRKSLSLKMIASGQGFLNKGEL
jgi:hypothetical protein